MSTTVTVAPRQTTVTVDASGVTVEVSAAAPVVRVDLGFGAASAIDAIESVGNGVLVTAAGVLGAVVGTTVNHALLWTGSTWAAGAMPYSALSGVPSTFTPSAHTHVAADVTDFNTAWTARLTAVGTGAASGDVLTWNGSAFAAAAPAVGYVDPLTTNGDLLVRAGGVTTRLAIGSNGQRLGVSSALPAWTWDGPAFAFGQGWSINRLAVASAPIAVAAQSFVRGATTFSAGVQNAWGMAQRCTTTTATTVSGAQVIVWDDLQSIGPHRFVGSGRFSGVVGNSGRRFFAGVAQVSSTGAVSSEFLTTDTPTQPGLGFFVRGSSDTTFQIVVADAANTEVVNTGITATEDADYGWAYQFRDVGGVRTVQWWIYSVTFGAAVALLGTGTVTCTANPTEALVSTPAGIIIAARADASGTYRVDFADALIFNWGGT